MIKNIFEGETFFFTSDPVLSLLNVPSLPDDFEAGIVASQAVVAFGGRVSPVYDPQTVTAIVISPKKVMKKGPSSP